MGDVLKLVKVNKSYFTNVETKVLFDVDMEFEEGSFNSLVGESGSGKSTLLNIMGTLDRPTSGEVYVGSVRTDTMKKNELARLRNETLGFVFQFHYLLPEFTALENVMMPFLISKKKPTPEIYKRAEELLEIMGIGQVKDNLATNMSGGQQQRTAIARALMNNPKLILADEPTGNLDTKTTRNVYDAFREINKKFGTTFIIVTHDRKIAEETDRIVEIEDGRIVTDIRK